MKEKQHTGRTRVRVSRNDFRRRVGQNEEQKSAMKAARPAGVLEGWDGTDCVSVTRCLADFWVLAGCMRCLPLVPLQWLGNDTG
jgi:hypothetical protein